MQRILPVVPLTLSFAALAVLPFSRASLAARQPTGQTPAIEEPADGGAPDGPSTGVKKVNQVLEQFERLKRKTQSLCVVFTSRSRFPGVEPDEWQGTLSLRHAADGTILGRFDARKKGSQEVGDHGLLVGDDVYFLNLADRTAVRISVAGEDKVAWIAKWIPIVVLLDPDRLRKDFQLQVSKQDEEYTHLTLEKKHPNRSGWFPDAMIQGEAVVQRKTTARMPEGAPCRLSYSNGFSKMVYEIREWKVNAPDAAGVREFVRPEGLPGWKTNGLSQTPAGGK